MRLTLIGFCLFLGHFLYGQTEPQIPKSTQAAARFTISGYVTDKTSGERLIGATVYDPQSLQGTTANQFGFYSVTLPAGKVSIKASFLGFKAENVIIDLQENKTLNFALEPQNELNTVEIVGTKEESIESKTQMSTVSIPINQIKSLPKFMGETDVLKAIQLLPGVKAGTEGTSGFYVRGGSPDQNLILLDGVPLYNVSHLFGFFSVFNGDAINSVNLYKGGFPSHFGGRLSSVLEVNTKDGNKEKIKGKIGVGLISSSIMLEGPVIKDKSTFIVSFRRTYIDALAQPFIRAATDGKTSVGYYFYDFNSKYSHKLNDRNKMFVSLYSGKDKFYVSDRTNNSKTKGGLGWGNLAGVLKLTSQQTEKLFANYSVAYSRYKFETKFESIDDVTLPENEQSSFYGNYFSAIKDWTAKVDYDYYVAPNHLLKFGGWFVNHSFNPGAIAFKDRFQGEVGIDTIAGFKPIYANEMVGYIEDDFKISDNLKVNYGLHYSNFTVQKTFYQSLQPRLAARYLLPNKMAIKASYARMAQYLHLLTNAGLGLPTDLWVPSTTRLLPERSSQVALGIAKSIWKNYELTIEGYYKTMSNIIEYSDGESYLNSSTSFDQKVEAGKGWSYGGEFLLQKKFGKSTGWIGYTLSWTTRQFPNLSGGQIFPYRYDRRHDVSVVYTYKFSPKFELSATWVYGTGNAVTLPVQIGQLTANQYYFFGAQSPNNIYYYGGTRNGFRMPSYHRADVSLNFIKQKKHGVRTWNISVYNAYNRMNPFYINQESDYQTGKTKFVQYSLFPLIPSFSYVYEF